MASHDIIRITRDIADIQQGTNLSIAVACSDSNVRKVSALIIGPPGTPYEHGFFEFSVKFTPEYPSKPPRVDARTTNGGRCRFNPNIYANGKVCLSILGTWPGEKGEEWSSAQGLESVLLSIQSLMSNTPYENEPGFESSTTDEDKAADEAYCDKIRHETLRISVIETLEKALNISKDKTVGTGHDENQSMEKLGGPEANVNSTSDKTTTFEPFEPFRDLQKQRFLWYFESYLKAIDDNASKHGSGKRFSTMPFEHGSNEMNGSFQYSELRERLLRIKGAIERETANWATEGMKEVAKESSLAYSLQEQFKEYAAYQKKKHIHNIEVNLEHGNPFVWIVSYFGRTGSNLDGGVFRIRLSLSPKFPQEQPRVKVETNMYHHRVSKDGVLCYFPGGTEEVKLQIDAVILALEEVSPPYDPRAIVHSEATKLFWGNEAEKKLYGRKQRRSAQDSVEQEAE